MLRCVAHVGRHLVRFLHRRLRGETHTGTSWPDDPGRTFEMFNRTILGQVGYRGPQLKS